MHILITGGAGFIGSHVVTACRAAGHEVRVLDALLPAVHPGYPDGVPGLAGVERRSDREWGNTAEPSCHTCGAMYLREVPYRAAA